MTRSRPAVGLLYNPATPDVIEHASDLVEYFAVMPDRLWFDFGPQTATGRRFHRTLGAMDQVRRLAKGRILAGHGLGLSLPSAMPLDEAFVGAIATVAADLGGFHWFSEHLSLFITPKGSVPNAQAGLGLPVVYDEEAFAIITSKLRRLRQALGCRLLLENGSFFTPVPDTDMSEPAFLNRLYAEGYCGTLLDLHNLYVTGRNGGMTPRPISESSIRTRSRRSTSPAATSSPGSIWTAIPARRPPKYGAMPSTTFLVFAGCLRSPSNFKKVITSASGPRRSWPN